MNILVTGADGYIGAVLAPYLMTRGHAVTGLDTGFYRSGWLYNDLMSRPHTVTRDIRFVEPEDLQGYETIIHLAELSNDPLSSHNRDTTYEINHRGSMHLARTAKAAGVRRFLYASSCSVYGAGTDKIKTESDAPNPQTAYAECKLLCERDLGELADDHFTVMCLRNATAFGASPRMRFDVVLNNLAGQAWTTSAIAMDSDGTPWRPLVHVLDISRAFELALAAPAERIQGQIINVGADDQNYQVRDIADVVRIARPQCKVSLGKRLDDNRSYRVSFAKIRKIFPEFQCSWSAARGASQLFAVFDSIALDRASFEAPAFTRLKQLKQLLATGQVDGRLIWQPVDRENSQRQTMLQLVV